MHAKSTYCIVCMGLLMQRILIFAPRTEVEAWIFFLKINTLNAISLVWLSLLLKSVLGMWVELFILKFLWYSVSSSFTLNCNSFYQYQMLISIMLHTCESTCNWEWFVFLISEAWKMLLYVACACLFKYK